jgi:hypothetical protein
MRPLDKIYRCLSAEREMAGCHARNRFISGSSHVVGPLDVRHTAATHP